MSLRLYLSPTEQVGGFAGIPRATQVFASSMGVPSLIGNYSDNGGIWEWYCMPGSGRFLPVFPFVTAKPTGAARIVSINDAVTLVTRPAGGTTYYQIASPMALGVMQITADLTVDPAAWMPTVGGTGQWAWEFRDENYSNGVAYEAFIFLIPAMAYIWRPSTASMVGVLWDVFAQNLAYEIGAWGRGTYNYYAMSGDWSTRWVYPAAGQCMYRGAENSGSPVWTNKLASVTCQAGDVLVVEYWSYSGRADSSFGSNQKFSMAIGGGTDATLTANKDSTGNPAYESTPTHNTFIDLPTYSSGSFPTDVPVPTGGKLIRVTPRAGKGLNLLFDASVGITGPTIDGPVDGIGVVSVTQVDSTNIDIDIDIPPTHPLGEASESPVPAPEPRGASLLNPPISPPSPVGAQPL